MRALTGGSVFLLLVVVLVSWDASRRFTHVQASPRMASFEAAPHARDVAAPDIARPRGGADVAEPGAGSPIPLQSAQPAARRVPEVQAPLPASRRDPERPAARRGPDAPTLPVRQFPPGSKGHVDAIVAAIDSGESRSTVAPLARLYLAFFDRTADYEGLNYYIGERDGGQSLDEIAEEFAGSEEFALRYGTLDNAAFIDRIYRNVFDAPPDAMQRAHWIAQLEAGVSRGQLMLEFSESVAFRTAASNEVFVTMAYAEALHRAPDPADFARWVRFLDAGNPREAMIAGLFAPRR